MTRFRCRRTAALAVAGTFGLAVAGCGSVPDDSTPTSGSDTAGPSASVAPGSGLDNVDWESSTFEKVPITKDGDNVKIDVGNGITVTQNAATPLRIAFLSQGSTNTYLQAMAEGAKDAAEAVGATLTVFDAGFDANTQLSQAQNAITSGNFDAFLTITVDNNGMCEILTKTAPEANILVANATQPLCGKDLAAGQDLWSPGTLTQTAGGGTLGFYETWAEGIASSLTAPTKAVYITGPEALTPVKAALQAIKDASVKYPNLEVVDVKYTDFSAAQALSGTQNALVTEPDTGIILSHFTALTTGIIQGLQQANKADQVDIYDIGGNADAVSYLNDGSIVQSVAYFPYSTAACAVELLAAAHSGTSVPTVVLNDCHVTEGGNGEEKPFVIDDSTVESFTPEY